MSCLAAAIVVDFNQQCHLLFDHPELLVHRLEVVSEEAGPVKQLLEVPQGDLPDGARQAAMSEIEGNPKMGIGWCSPRHEGGDGAGGEVDDLCRRRRRGGVCLNWTCSAPGLALLSLVKDGQLRYKWMRSRWSPTSFSTMTDTHCSRVSRMCWLGSASLKLTLRLAMASLATASSSV